MRKVVPVILRHHHQVLEILVFRHPLAGIQLVKGTIEQDEPYEQVAVRELFEESGLIAQTNPKFLGNTILKSNQQEWYFYWCETSQSVADA